MATPPEIVPENDLIAVRLRKAEELAGRGFPSYPDADALRPTITSAPLIARYDGKTAPELEALAGPDDTHRIAGRIIALRDFGKGAFVKLRDRDGEVQ